MKLKPLAKDFYKSLRKRPAVRRTMYSPLLNFLKNPNKEPDFDKDLDTILIKAELEAQKVLKKIVFHSASIIASQTMRTLLPLLKSYLMKNVKAL